MGYEGVAFDVDSDDFYLALDSIKTCNKIDDSGISVSALRVVAFALPEFATAVLNSVLKLSRNVSSLRVVGHVKGKHSPTTSAEDLRAIMGQPSLLQVCDF